MKVTHNNNHPFIRSWTRTQISQPANPTSIVIQLSFFEELKHGIFFLVSCLKGKNKSDPTGSGRVNMRKYISVLSFVRSRDQTLWPLEDLLDHYSKPRN